MSRTKREKKKAKELRHRKNTGKTAQASSQNQYPPEEALEAPAHLAPASRQWHAFYAAISREFAPREVAPRETPSGET